MRYASFRRNGRDGVGLVEGDTVVPLEGIERISSAVGTDALASARRRDDQAVSLEEVALLPASPAPNRILCVGLNYKGHILETGRELPTYPVLFAKFASNLVGARDDIRLPAESSQVDYEGELALVIGRGGRRIAEEDALAHVLGFTVSNDVTMRDFQYKTHQWIQGKAWDDSTPVGPFIVTPDEVDLDGARLRTTVNGQVVQDDSVGDLLFTVPTLIAQISTFTRLEPGDLILTGTPGGVGYRRDPQLFLGAGDVAGVEIDGIGSITNTVVPEA